MRKEIECERLGLNGCGCGGGGGGGLNRAVESGSSGRESVNAERVHIWFYARFLAAFWLTGF